VGLLGNADYEQCFKVDDIAYGLESVFRMLETENNVINAAASNFIANSIA
jgi:hypothetical protein